MNIGQSLIEALESITANKLRSGLTMLGIVIGVAAVIAMLAIGNGASASITEQIDSLGTNLLFVNSGGDASIPEPLTLEDVEAIAQAESVLDVTYVLQGQVSVAVPSESTNTSMTGITPEYFSVQNVVVEEGDEINTEHLENQDTVVLLGTDVADELFGRTTNLVGESVRINGQPFDVIGVLEEEGSTGFGGGQDNRILVPFTTADARLMSRDGVDVVDTIYVQAVSAEAVEIAEEEVAQILRAQHISTLGVDDFEILTTTDFLEVADSITGTLTVFLGGVGAISLLVGGIGIMNIMFVTVIERTKEIGLRKAMGARKGDILSQFLIESLVLSLAGGLIGILLGIGISSLVSGISFGPGGGGGGFGAVVTLESILLATLFSAAVGIFFGLYPANRAANLEPVEALRSE
ncbi:MAG: ABC transporter permease [Chloroflexi bacterium]|nr:MAG: ABC transporter permease [Chloroflexota bacterium]MBL1196721.1 FtsX-like permease family protein [Chloroflexota bacterium]NOH14014.1 FtsX-like permease family protein [Chloroflexota bacterium]